MEGSEALVWFVSCLLSLPSLILPPKGLSHGWRYVRWQDFAVVVWEVLVQMRWYSYPASWRLGHEN